MGISQVETLQEDGSKCIVFPNGTRKVISREGKSSTVHFFNGDIKQIKPDQTVVCKNIYMCISQSFFERVVHCVVTYTGVLLC